MKCDESELSVSSNVDDDELNVFKIFSFRIVDNFYLLF